MCMHGGRHTGCKTTRSTIVHATRRPDAAPARHCWCVALSTHTPVPEPYSGTAAPPSRSQIRSDHSTQDNSGLTACVESGTRLEDAHRHSSQGRAKPERSSMDGAIARDATYMAESTPHVVSISLSSPAQCPSMQLACRTSWWPKVSLVGNSTALASRPTA